MEDTRIVIFSGGTLGEWALAEIRPSDILVGVDRGALFLLEHGIQPHVALGDFDSVTPEQFARIEKSIPDLTSCDPIAKDLTDSEMAFDWALAQGKGEIVLLGVTGTRFDHTLANVHLLYKGLQAGARCLIRDENNEIRLINQTTSITKGDFSHVSLLPLSMKATGITLEGFAYPLHNAELTIGQSLGVSNILLQSIGTIHVSSGELLVIQSKD